MMPKPSKTLTPRGRNESCCDPYSILFDGKPLWNLQISREDSYDVTDRGGDWSVVDSDFSGGISGASELRNTRPDFMRSLPGITRSGVPPGISNRDTLAILQSRFLLPSLLARPQTSHVLNCKPT